MVPSDAVFVVQLNLVDVHFVKDYVAQMIVHCKGNRVRTDMVVFAGRREANECRLADSLRANDRDVEARQGGSIGCRDLSSCKLSEN